MSLGILKEIARAEIWLDLIGLMSCFCVGLKYGLYKNTESLKQFKIWVPKEEFLKPKHKL